MMHHDTVKCMLKWPNLAYVATTYEADTTFSFHETRAIALIECFSDEDSSHCPLEVIEHRVMTV